MFFFCKTRNILLCNQKNKKTVLVWNKKTVLSWNKKTVCFWNKNTFVFWKQKTFLFWNQKTFLFWNKKTTISCARTPCRGSLGTIKSGRLKRNLLTRPSEPLQLKTNWGTNTNQTHVYPVVSVVRSI